MTMADLMFPWLFQHSELGLRSLAGTTIEQRTFTTVYVSELRRPTEFTFPGAGVKARRSEASFLGVHRHTVRSRIARVQQLAGVDLEDPLTPAELVLVPAG